MQSYQVEGDGPGRKGVLVRAACLALPGPKLGLPPVPSSRDRCSVSTLPTVYPSPRSPDFCSFTINYDAHPPVACATTTTVPSTTITGTSCSRLLPVPHEHGPPHWGRYARCCEPALRNGVAVSHTHIQTHTTATIPQDRTKELLKSGCVLHQHHLPATPSSKVTSSRSGSSSNTATTCGEDGSGCGAGGGAAGPMVRFPCKHHTWESAVARLRGDPLDYE